MTKSLTDFSQGETHREHFKVFCLAMEKGFAIHTGSTSRLVLDFQLQDSGLDRHLPRIRPYSKKSYLVPERYLEASDLYLYYDPEDDSEIPQLAHVDAESGNFVPYTKETLENLNSLHAGITAPVAKLVSLRGLHYMKNVSCLQLHSINFDQLYALKPALAERLRLDLAAKLNSFFDFDHIWKQADYYESVARKYLDEQDPPA